MLCETTCGVILAGGKGRRLGGRKPFLQLGGRTLLERVADRLSTLFSEVVLVADCEADFRVFPFRTLTDRIPNLGPLGGIETALRKLPDKSLFVVGCDMPFLNYAVIKAMLPLAEEYELVIPFLSGRFHPLHAIYTPKCLTAIKVSIREGDLAPHRLPKKVKHVLFPEETFRKIDPHFRSVLNINTPEDLSAAEHFWGSRDEMSCLEETVG